MEIGDKIRSLRHNRDLTQSELAKELGVSTSAVGLWELNRREPDYDTLCRISKFFKVTVDYILEKESANTITIIGSSGSYKKFSLTDKELEAITNLIETMGNNMK